MASYNRFQLVGNVTRNPELKTTPNGVSVLDLGLAVDGVSSGKEEAQTDFFTVTVWDKQAEACAKHLQKGSLVLVDGRVRHARWEEEGQKRSRVELVASNVQFLAGIKKADAPAVVA